MRVGTKVKTPDGRGLVIESIGPAPKNKPILVRLDKRIGIYHNFFYSMNELKVI